ncbi:Smr/MutS family protein [Coralloluteibacterium thermophilus]|uniref:Smr/MutS family protein n=1 Tax=Coralloluteibacterium thermophilum TaxID=2707049 RepID=A0ABV9NMN1_9GAMM
MAHRRRPPPPPPVDPDDAALFREAIGEVRRIEAPATQPRPRPAPRPVKRTEDEYEALRALRETPLASFDAAEALAWRRDDVPAATLKRLRRGEFAVQGELDLHRADAVQAERLLREFLHAARGHRARCVLVIHGKGLRSEDGVPVLKALVDRLLQRRDDVLAYASPPPALGGTGAVLVLLRPK